MRNLERLIYQDGILRHIIWIEYLGNVYQDKNNYWFEIINFGKGKNNVTGEIEFTGNDGEKLIRLLLKKVK